MIRAGSAVSESRTAPRTDCSASRFCGGATGPSKRRPPPSSWGELWPLVRSGALIGRPSLGPGPVAQTRPSGPTLLRPQNCREAVTELARGAAARLLLLDDHRLDGRRDAGRDLDDDHPRADGLDRLVEVDVAPVDRDAAGVVDRIGDVLRRDRSEESPVLTRLMRDREHGAVEQLRALARPRLGVGDRALGCLLAPAGRLDRAPGGGLGELARDQEV